MVSTLEKRVSRLEAAYGGGDACPRCRNTQIIVGTSKEVTVIKDRVLLGPAESERFYLEEQPNGQCPRCGGFRERRVIRWGREDSLGTSRLASN